MTQYIWPDKHYVTNAHIENPAIPKVESLAATKAKYGENDWRTWRAQYFENRLALADDGYRYEHTSYNEAKFRGMMCNIWTGTPYPVHGLTGEQSKNIIYPLTGDITQQFSSAMLHKGEGCQIHSYMHSEVICLVWHGCGEYYLYDQWIPVTADDIMYVPVGCPFAYRCPADSEKDMVVFLITSPPPLSEYIMHGFVEKDEGEIAKKLDWGVNWRFTNPGNAGLVGHPEYINTPVKR